MLYFEDQKEFEKDIDAFKREVRFGILHGYRELITNFSRVEICPIYLYDEPTEKYEKFDIAD